MNNPHQNARTTFYSRALIVQRVLKERRSVREVAEALGVSRRTIYKWLVRYKQGGQDKAAASAARRRIANTPKRCRQRSMALPGAAEAI